MEVCELYKLVVYTLLISKTFLEKIESQKNISELTPEEKFNNIQSWAKVGDVLDEVVELWEKLGLQHQSIEKS